MDQDASGGADARRQIPAAHRLLDALRSHPELGGLRADVAQRLVRDFQARVRRELDAGARGPGALEPERLERELVAEVAARTRGVLPAVVNASGVVLHTNLGRSTLPPAALAALEQAAGSVALELDLATGRRGRRGASVEGLLCLLTGAEAATAVNNNAAAVLLMLSALCAGREVVVSRGEQVEIGGGFRIPEILRQSGARLVEVGTTNCTYARDYAAAIGEHTAALLRVHPSNYRISGHTHGVELPELAALARARGVLLLEDLGSGCLVDLRRLGLPPEPVVSDQLAAGVDLVCFSGDKLLGGPQAGCVAGRAELVEALDRHPLKRAVRLDKLGLAALAATLERYLYEDALVDAIPALRLLTRPLAEIDACAHKAAALLRERLGGAAVVSVRDCESEPGSGSYPGVRLASRAVVLTASAGPERLFRHFLAQDPPILGRIEDGALVLDLRTVLDPAVFARVRPLAASEDRA